MHAIANFKLPKTKFLTTTDKQVFIQHLRLYLIDYIILAVLFFDRINYEHFLV